MSGPAGTGAKVGNRGLMGITTCLFRAEVSIQRGGGCLGIHMAGSGIFEIEIFRALAMGAYLWVNFDAPITFCACSTQKVPQTKKRFHMQFPIALELFTQTFLIGSINRA